jgi:isopenicillin-N N-acyltransferase like protein
VSPPPTIPVIRVAGSHREIGRQVGEAATDAVRAITAELTPVQLAAAEPYREVTARELPWLIEELDGVAEGAGVDAAAVFTASIEELEAADPANEGRCSDMVACPQATADGHLWVAHNNDLGPSAEERLVAIEWLLEGDPAVFTIGIGPWISVGFNSAGLALTGNEVSPNDNRVGIPRLLQVRDIIRRWTIDEAVAAALHPARASSYNNLLSHRDGSVVNVEGSATNAELIRPDERGTLAHTNHYVSGRMRAYEGDVPYAWRSEVRYRRALEWLQAERITPELLREALSDHTGAPDSLCRHVAPGSESKTVFWVIADVSTGEITYGRGNPCDSEEQHHAFA